MRVSKKDFASYARNHTPMEIAEHFGLSRNYTYKRLQELGCAYLKQNIWKTRTAAIHDELISTAGSMTAKEASKKFGLSLSWIYHLQKVLKIEFKDGRQNKNRGRDEEIKRLVKFYTYERVGEKFGLTKQRIEQIVNKGK